MFGEEGSQVFANTADRAVWRFLAAPEIRRAYLTVCDASVMQLKLLASSRGHPPGADGHVGLALSGSFHLL